MLRTIAASLRVGLKQKAEDLSNEAEMRAFLKFKASYSGYTSFTACGWFFTIFYLFVILVEQSFSFAARLAELEETGDDYVLGTLTVRQSFWLLFGLRIFIALPVMMLMGFGERYNLVYQNYLQLYNDYAVIQRRLGEPVEVEWAHENIVRGGKTEKLQGVLCGFATLAINTMSESLLDCVLNLMAVHLLTNFDEWMGNNIVNSGWTLRSLAGNSDEKEPLYIVQKWRHLWEAPSPELEEKDPCRYVAESYIGFWGLPPPSPEETQRAGDRPRQEVRQQKGQQPEGPLKGVGELRVEGPEGDVRGGEIRK
uniref:Uncharacterized protein n=1 Tax=Chromera velia CCMP2878 TaxID=1169474 RepID=A0A0G4HIZ6_9ALVE|eukprot:Cvel_7067.t1-p1 / transcript=Cvel_7067.t1 / gene=Cvel_7067 / organism=Chromera_velia_CCMP2878 / gene_product=hypothetical protein / transcript_product=hypothetical protein / location=Cvel_scaffold361:63870-65424(-) / protein_length=309 / sequence_SO=supercontig / SO=protein_coding / is_pseudo=false